MSLVYPRARTVQAGEGVSASNTNRYRRALIAIQQGQNYIAAQSPRAWQESMLHEITAIEDDWLECIRIYIRRKSTPIPGAETVLVARPQRLRASEATRDGITYTKVDAQTRTAVKGADTETQVVTPVYLVGDWIEVRPLRGRSGIDAVDEQRRALVDGNADGRAYAAEPPP